MASKKTARSQRHARHQNQDYLSQYGYPSQRELQREAHHLAHSAVPTVRSVRRPYQRQMQSTKDFLAAINAALAQTSAGVGQGYDTAIQQSQATDQAAQARLQGLGLSGADNASAQAVTGALGDSATQNLISNAASAKNYAAKLPGIAAGQASVQRATLNKGMLDALANRRDSLSQAYFQALQQVQSSHLQQASFNQASDQFAQQMAQSQAQMAEGIREFNASQAQSAHQFNEQMAYNYASLAAQAAGSSSGGGGKGKLSRSSVRQIAHSMGLTPNEVMGRVDDAQQILAGSDAAVDKVPVYKTDKDGNRYIDHYKATLRMSPNGQPITEDGKNPGSAISHGVLFPTAIRQLMQQGVSPQIAVFAAARLYKDAKGMVNAQGLHDDTAWHSFAKWMAEHGSARYRRLLAKYSYTPRDFPGNQ